jgi:hypothetical protein
MSSRLDLKVTGIEVDQNLTVRAAASGAASVEGVALGQ